MTTAVILVRVSSEEQEQGYSLDAQLANLQSYAERKGLEVIRVFRIIESTTKGPRPEFERLIQFIGKQKQRTALIVDCVDRLQRSFTHTPVLNSLMEKDLLEIHFVREGNVIDRNANSMQKMMWNMGTVMAQSYTDQLADNVKRSIKHKIAKGEWIAKAPLGYRHEPDGKTGRSRIVVDPDRAHLVQRMFLTYVTGTASFAELRRKTIEWGMRTDKGNALMLQTVCDTISNPFYIGQMKIKGELYPHNYPTFIDQNLFDACQAVREKINHPWKAIKETRANFLLRGLITCAVSGRKVTCDLKKGRYVYLVTRDPANPNKKQWIKERTVLRQIEAAINSFAIPDKFLAEIIDYVRTSHEAEKAFHYEQVRALNVEKNALTAKLNRLTDLLLEGHIMKEVYDSKYKEICQRRDEISRLLTGNDKGDMSFKGTLSDIVALMTKTPILFRSSKTDEKRHLLGLVFSNLQLEGATLRYTLRKPFDVFAKVPTTSEWRALEDSNL